MQLRLCATLLLAARAAAQACECSSHATGCLADGVDVSDMCGCSESGLCYVVSSLNCVGHAAASSFTHPGAKYIDCTLAATRCPEWCSSFAYTCDIYGCENCDACSEPRPPPSPPQVPRPPPAPPSPPRQPAMPGDVRLCQDSFCSPDLDQGRVEVYHCATNSGICSWGTVCDDGWGQDEARTVCKQLGFRDAIYHWSNAHFGPGEAASHIWMDDVDCTGLNTRLDGCVFAQGWGVHNCAHSEDAGVSCDPLHGPPLPPAPPPSPPKAPMHEGSLRLVGGTRATETGTPLEGRLEITHCPAGGSCSWGTICDDDFGEEEAIVACRQLGLGSPLQWQGAARFGRGEGIIWLSWMECTGAEAHLGECEFWERDWGVNDCSHSEDASLVCSDGNVPPSPPSPPPAPPAQPTQEGDVRLVEGPEAKAGRVEVYHDGEWGSVCDDGWGLSEARTVCRQLGYADAAPYRTNEYGYLYSYDSGAYWDYDWDDGWWDDWYNSYGWSGQRRPPPPGPSLSPPPPPPHVATNGEEEAYGEMHYGRGTGRIWLDDVTCREGTARLDQCGANTWGVNDCSHSEDVGVRCVGHRTPAPPSPPPSPPSPPYSEGQLRLAGGSAPWEGRVEVLHDGLWGSVCDDYWGQDEARVVCNQLGYPGGVALALNGYEARARFSGEAAGPIWLDDVDCRPGVDSLAACSHNLFGVNDCSHGEDAGVVCAAPSFSPPPRPPPSPPALPHECGLLKKGEGSAGRTDMRPVGMMSCTDIPNSGGMLCDLLYVSGESGPGLTVCLRDGTNGPSDGYCDASEELVCSPPPPAPPPPALPSVAPPPASRPPPGGGSGGEGSSNLQPGEKKKGGGGAALPVVLVLLALASAGGAYWYGRKKGWFTKFSGNNSVQPTNPARAAWSAAQMSAPLSANAVPPGSYVPPVAGQPPVAGDPAAAAAPPAPGQV